MDECRKRGWYVHRDLVCEVMTIRKTRRDFLGVIDMVTFPDPIYGCLGIQVTAAGSHAARRTKALANPHLPYWLKGGNYFEIWSWRKKGRIWVVREEEITWTPRGLEARPAPRAGSS
jgi:hypothetical protein